MKKVICLMLSLLLMGAMTACSTTPQYVPAGYTSAETHFDKASFQDFTDFCIYRYASDEAFADNTDYRQITAADTETVAGYFEDFQMWMEAEDRLTEYSFDPACISEGDYLHIETREGDPIGDGEYGAYDDYTLWFFDTETLTLYYIHNNI